MDEPSGMARLPVDSSWRMVEGANDSFDTSVVPSSFPHELDDDDDADDDKHDTDPFVSSGSVAASQSPMPSFYSHQTSNGYRLDATHDATHDASKDNPPHGDSFASSSTGPSQDDDLHAFLLKAGNEDRALRRSPFQPSLPSSMRHLVDLQMPAMDTDGSVCVPDGRPSSASSADRPDLDDARPARPARHPSNANTWRLVAGLVAGLVAFLAVVWACDVPFGDVPFGDVLVACPATSTPAIDHGPPYSVDTDLAETAVSLVRVQAQLADAITHILPGHDNKNNPSAHDAFRVPVSRTRGLLALAQQQQQHEVRSGAPGTEATLFLLALDAYLAAARRVSAALLALQTGAAATTPHTLADSTRRTLARVQRLADDYDSSGSSGADTGTWPWRARETTMSDASVAENLAAAYRQHAQTLLDKTASRVAEARGLLDALDTAGDCLKTVHAYVVARLARASDATDDDDDDASARPGLGLLSWLASLFTAPDAADSVHQWAVFADDLDALQADHDAAVGRALDALDALAAVHDALAHLDTVLGAVVVDTTRPDLAEHLDTVAAALHHLDGM